MIYEQISTSAPKCLDGNAGFGTVAQTTGMPPAISQTLNALSGYTHRFPMGSPKNPVVFLHTVRNRLHVLSRIADCGKDYSGRTNRIAHHIVLDEAGIRPLTQGPTTLLQHYPFQTSWNQDPQVLPPRSLPPLSSPVPHFPLPSWQRLGDAGWGGMLAERIEAGQTVNVVFEPVTNMLPLLDEAFSLLPLPLRWQISFSTYFIKTQETPDSSIRVRCLLAGSDEMAYTKMPNSWTLDLRALQGSPTGSYAEWAKTGPKTPSAPSASVASAVPVSPAASADSETYSLSSEPQHVPLPQRRFFKRGQWDETMEAQPQKTKWNIVIVCLLALIVILLILLTVGGFLLFGEQKKAFDKVRQTFDQTAKRCDELRQEVINIQKANSTEIQTIHQVLQNESKKLQNENEETKKQLAQLEEKWSDAKEVKKQWDKLNQVSKLEALWNSFISSFVPSADEKTAPQQTPSKQ